MLILRKEQTPDEVLVQATSSGAVLESQWNPLGDVVHPADQFVGEIESKAYTAMLVGVMGPQNRVVPVSTEAQQSVRFVEFVPPTPQTAPELHLLIVDREQLKGIVQITKSRDPYAA